MIPLLLALSGPGSAPAAESFTLRARQIHTVSGARLEDSSVGVRDGKISGVGRGAGGRVFEGGSLTPGLIDDEGEVTDRSVKDFLVKYLEEFLAFVERVYTVLPRREGAGVQERHKAAR